MRKYLKADYGARNPEYADAEANYEFLLETNHVLQTLETSLYHEVKEEQPFIFIFGVPRTGTTLLTQILSYALDVGYINNIMARFWLAPVCGIRISRALLGRSRSNVFESEYGRTEELTGRHEFAYFWQYWLKKESIADFLLVNEGEDEMDWAGFRRAMLNIQAEFGKPMVFKNIIGANHLKRIHEVLKKTVWVYIERDPMDTALSIFNARKKINQNPDVWWSTYPPEYELLKESSCVDQIAGQIVFLRRLYEQQMQTIEHDCIIRTTYRELCDSPRDILENVRTRVKKLYDCDIPVVASLPDHYSRRSGDRNGRDGKALERALARAEQQT